MTQENNEFIKMVTQEISQIEDCSRQIRSSLPSGYTLDTLPSSSNLAESMVGVLAPLLRHLGTLRYIEQPHDLVPSRSALLAFFLLDQSLFDLTLAEARESFSSAKQANLALLKQASSFLRSLPLPNSPLEPLPLDDVTYLALADSLLLQIDLLSDLSQRGLQTSFLESLGRTLFRTMEALTKCEYLSNLHISIVAGHFLAYPEDAIDPFLAASVADKLDSYAQDLSLSSTFPSLFSSLE